MGWGYSQSSCTSEVELILQQDKSECATFCAIVPSVVTVRQSSVGKVEKNKNLGVSCAAFPTSNNKFKLDWVEELDGDDGTGLMLILTLWDFSNEPQTSTVICMLVCIFI